MSNVKRQKLWMMALLVAFVLLAATYSIVTPILEASDELWHYPVVQYIASGRGLPVQTPPERAGLWKQQASQPPLYYALAALLTAWVDTSDLTQTLRWNPYAAVGEVTPDGNINMVTHDPAREAWPWRGTVLAIHIARLFSVALGAVTVYLTYRLGREAFPDRAEIALGAAALTAFTPMFTFLSGSVNNDDLVTPLCALALLIMIRQVGQAQGLPLPQVKILRQGQNATGDERRLWVGYWGLGVVIGLATLSKVSGLALLPLAALTGVWVAWRRGAASSRPATERLGSDFQSRAGSHARLLPLRSGGSWRGAAAWEPPRLGFLGLLRLALFGRRIDWRHLLTAGLAIGLPVLLITGWWFWRNLQLYGDLLGFKMFTPYFTRAVPADLAQIWSERISFLYGYWGNFGGLNLPIPAWAFTTLNVLLALSALGLVIAFLQFVVQIASRSSLFTLRPSSFVSRNGPLFFIALWAVIVFVSWLNWTRTTWSSQGRLVFYALPAYSILIVAGLAAWMPRRLAPYLVAALGVGMALLSAAMPLAVIAPAYARPPQLTEAQIASLPQRTDVTFGDALVLLGYDAPSAPVKPGDSIRLTLYWHALGPTDREYSVFVHLLNEDELEAQDKGPAYPGRGNLPSTTLAPGQTWAETWVVPIRGTAYAPARLMWEIGLFDPTSGARLPAVDRSGRAVGDSCRFGQIELTRPSGSPFNPVAYDFDDQIELIGFDLDRRTVRPGDTLHLTLYWRAVAQPLRDYTVFVHVLGKQQDKVAARDAQPSPPTSRWEPGQVVTATYPLQFDAAAKPDVYDIAIGVYYFTGASSFQRLKVITRDGRQQQDVVWLGKVRVVR